MHPMRVLVVDDEVRLAAAVQRGLQAEGFTVDVAHTGLDGLWAATEQRYDAIVLDIMLPGMNGYRVCAELRNRGVDTPILMLTAKDGEFDEAEALDTGADDFLSKPFSYVVLVARLRALIRRWWPCHQRDVGGQGHAPPGSSPVHGRRSAGRPHQPRVRDPRVPCPACR